MAFCEVHHTNSGQYEHLHLGCATHLLSEQSATGMGMYECECKFIWHIIVKKLLMHSMR